MNKKNHSLIPLANESHYLQMEKTWNSGEMQALVKLIGDHPLLIKSKTRVISPHLERKKD